ncbi:Periplasmic binding protein domain-containing protein [Desulfonema limicola]|uniref:Periplasmic binding protein domain-containing protein n=1 Tax=Desulfonema limicola TaxID=45656 RepID=A0A975B778_9BACT|nr:ABC transporter substrate-binding protein [Desulfonema limicola]QTA80058.1 Periplasmic binding protein domain-containing protein [Desulfonema limicola]
MIKWFVKEKWQGSGTPRIGIMAADVPSWRILSKPGMMDNYIRSVGGELAGIEFIPLVTPDLSTTIGKLVMGKKANALILIGTSSQTVVLAKSMKQMGIDPQKTTVLCNISAWDETLFKSVPLEIEGFYGEVHTVLPDENAPGMARVREVAALAGRTSEEIVVNYINGVIGSMVLETAVRNALEKHGYEKVAGSGEYIRNEIHTLKPFDPLGLTAPVGVLHPDQPYFYNHARIVKASKGKFIEAGKWISIDRIQGSME